MADACVTAVSAAREIGVSRQYVSRLCLKGSIPGAYLDNRSWFVPLSWVSRRKKRSRRKDTCCI